MIMEVWEYRIPQARHPTDKTAAKLLRRHTLKVAVESLTMRFDETRSHSRSRGSRSFAEAKNKYYPTRGGRNDDSVPSSEDESTRRDDAFRVRGCNQKPAETSFRRRDSRNMRGLGGELSHELNSRGPDEGMRYSSMSSVPRESPYTQGISEPSDEDSEGGLPEATEGYKSDSQAADVPSQKRRNQHGSGKKHNWQNMANLYDEVFSGDSDSKSHSSSDSSGSYTSYDDDDDDEDDDRFQLNANCMNALFSKDAQQSSSNLIRCDRAGPSATEVQLRMTLPLPLQLMEGLDNLVPSRQEVKSAIHHLRINGDKIAKKCDFDYSRLDEQVIIDEVVGGAAMPQFYKSLFESPTEITSDEEDESVHQTPRISPVCRKPAASAFTPNPNMFKPVPPKMETSHSSQSIVRPGSLPSHIVIDGNGSFVSSQDSFEMMPFGMKRQFQVQAQSVPVPHDFRKGTRLTPHTSSPDKDMQASGMLDSEPSFDVPPARGGAMQSSAPFQPSMRDLIASRVSTEAQKALINTVEPRKRGIQLSLEENASSAKLGSDCVQEHPSFDEDKNTKYPGRADRQWRQPVKEKNALSKFSTSSKLGSLVSKDWVPAKKEQLDLVDGEYPSFDAPDDEIRKNGDDAFCKKAESNTIGVSSLYGGIPTSVRYCAETNDRDLRVSCSELTSDEEGFDKTYPLIQTLSMSDQSNADIGDLGATVPRNSKGPTPNEESSNWQNNPAASMSSGDELMGRRDKLWELGDDQKTQAREAVLLDEVPPGHEVGPLDELMDKNRVALSTGMSRPTESTASTKARTSSSEPGSLGNPTSPEARVVATSYDIEDLKVISHLDDPSRKIRERDLVLKTSVDAASSNVVPTGDVADLATDEPGTEASKHEALSLQGNEETSVSHGASASRSLISPQSNCITNGTSFQSANDSTQGETDKTTPVDNTEARIADDGSEISESRSEASISEDFPARLKCAAAARLESMNGMLGTETHEHGKESGLQTATRSTPSTEESFEPPPFQEDQGEYDGERNRDCGGITAGETEDSRNGWQDENGSEADEFLDPFCQDMPLEERSRDGTKSVAHENEQIRFVSEIDARSQAVEINYIGERESRASDSYSLATAPPLEISHTTTTIETPLTSAHTMLTMDTPVVAPPGGTFDTLDRSLWGSGSRQKRREPSSDFYVLDDPDGDEGDYHFDERLAKLSALLPASNLRKQQTRDVTSFNVVHFFVNGLAAIIMFFSEWLKHLLGLQGTQDSRLLVTKGEPNFRRNRDVVDMQATNSQKIQGFQHTRYGVRHLEREAGTYIDFVVPDIHGKHHVHRDQPIWTVNSSERSRGRKSSEAHSSGRSIFSRGDTNSVGSLKGWSAKPNFCETEFREE